jgi:hypothetical protein
MTKIILHNIWKKERRAHSADYSRAFTFKAAPSYCQHSEMHFRCLCVSSNGSFFNSNKWCRRANGMGSSLFLFPRVLFCARSINNCLPPSVIPPWVRHDASKRHVDGTCVWIFNSTRLMSCLASREVMFALARSVRFLRPINNVDDVLGQRILMLLRITTSRSLFSSN